MKAKMKLENFKVKSFTTEIKKNESETVKGGEFDTPIVSFGLSHKFVSCDCTGLFVSECCDLG